MNNTTALKIINGLPLWHGKVTATPLGGGLTNHNFLVRDANTKFVVRLGEDITAHHVMRFNELAASCAAHAAGLSPAVVFADTGVMVLDYIDSRTLTESDVADPAHLPDILALIRKCHRDVAAHLRGPTLIFWVFHVIRDYGATLGAANSSYGDLVGELVDIGNRLETQAAPFDMVFCHNDLLAANFLDDGARLWLIDWDYAGYNTPLFDLGGLASNNGFSDAQEIWLLENYFETPVKGDLLHRYAAMKCASLLRETMWSMVSEITSTLDFDYSVYTAENLKRFYAALDTFNQT